MNVEILNAGYSKQTLSSTLTFYTGRIRLGKWVNRFHHGTGKKQWSQLSIMAISSTLIYEQEFPICEYILVQRTVPLS